jgi:ABC-type antimicrobial peptide transport system permease subunit
VAVISKRFADSLMPGLDPLGRELLRNNPPAVTIVGVVDDASDVTAAEQAEPTFYVAWSQNNAANVPIAFVIRTAVDPSSLVPALRERVKRVDPSLPLRKPQPLEVFVTESTAPERFRVSVLGILAALGLLLAVLGIAGVTYRSVIDRTKDFAVRLALGSGPGQVIRLVLFDSLRDVAVGVAAGVVGGAATCALLARSVQNVAPTGAITTAITIAIVVSAGTAAALVPALRIMRVEPAGVLRG